MEAMRIPDGAAALQIGVAYRWKLRDSKSVALAAHIALRFFDSNQVEFDPQPAPIALADTTNQWQHSADDVPVPPGRSR